MLMNHAHAREGRMGTLRDSSAVRGRHLEQLGLGTSEHEGRDPTLMTTPGVENTRCPQSLSKLGNGGTPCFQGEKDG